MANDTGAVVRNTIMFPEDLYGRIRSLAAAEHRSIASEVLVLVEEAMANRERAEAAR